MYNTPEQEQISLADKIHACESHSKALEKKLKEVKYDYSRIVARRDAVYFKLGKYGLATIVLVIVLIVLAVIVFGTVDDVVKLHISSSEDGLTVLYGLLAIAFDGLGCIWLGIRMVRLIKMAMELKEQEISLGAKLSFDETKLEECRKELEDLLSRQHSC